MVSVELPDYKPNRSSPWYWFTSFRLSRAIAVLLLVLVLVPLFTHYYLSKFDSSSTISEVHHTGVQLEDLDSIKTVDLSMRIEEMIRIKNSVSSELRDLESRRQKLQAEITTLTQKVEDLKAEFAHQQVELDRIRVSVDQAQYAHKEVLERNTPHISPPRRILPSLEDSVFMPPISKKASGMCLMHTCFDYSRCSLTSGFPVYFYHPDDFKTSWSATEQTIKSAITEALNMNIHITFDPAIACIFVVLVGDAFKEPISQRSLENYLRSLAHWNGDGRNHVILRLFSDFNSTEMFDTVNTDRAIIVQPHFKAADFRDAFDIIMPPLSASIQSNTIESVMLHSPARRKFLLSYQGEYRTFKPPPTNVSSKLSRVHHSTFHDDSDIGDAETSLQNTASNQAHVRIDSYSEKFIIDVLKEIQMSATTDNFFFQFSCAGSSIQGLNTEWLLCGTAQSRLTLLKESTFSLIVSPMNWNLISTTQFQVRVYESLQAGAIPVILGNHMRLPFDEFIDWKRAVILLPKARVTELHYYLRTFSDADILQFRRQGHLLWERYLAEPRQIIDTVLAIIRNRIQIPATAVQEELSPSVFNASFQPLRTEFAAVQDADPEENLGPIEPSFPSPYFQRNMTYTNAQQNFVWNDLIDPFTLYPHTPFDPIIPSEAKFIGSSFGFRPIGQGAGGSGKEFSEALGGNSPREQFTIVMLTYEREAVLIDSLQRLRGLPYLNKVVVVWNSARPPAPDLRWPEIGVPIQVIKAKKNSLNNRFLPYDSIETEAILSVDDDAHLRHDEIIFGFRVWRESRDRIVGFPGRYHAWDSLSGNWLYNSNYSCELSMVLTGASFFHKGGVTFPQATRFFVTSPDQYYSYLYSYSMPQLIRDKVDEYMNCEDIAMNFLVSHVTRKPPLKVTSRWTFRCPGCPISLSEEDSHFQERHKCINFFVQMYGYMPLLSTQFRVDSVLFKTRIPHDKQKCFKFI